MVTENLCTVVSLGKHSQLKTDLNRAIMALSTAPESYFRPHACLNGLQGIEVLQQISADSNTEVSVRPHLIVSCDDIWLNVKI